MSKIESFYNDLERQYTDFIVLDGEYKDLVNSDEQNNAYKIMDNMDLDKYTEHVEDNEKFITHHMEMLLYYPDAKLLVDAYDANIFNDERVQDWSLSIKRNPTILFVTDTSNVYTRQAGAIGQTRCCILKGSQYVTYVRKKSSRLSITRRPILFSF